MRWFTAFCSQQVAALSREVASLRNQLQALRTSREEWRRECQHVRTKLALAEEAGRDAVSQVAALELDLAARRTAERELTDRLAAAEERAAKLALDLAGVHDDLRRTQHELDLSNKQLELASKENELLAKIHQGDLARRERELALEKRAKADAELASPLSALADQ
jgi:chromosome segregation ATPase